MVFLYSHHQVYFGRQTFLLLQVKLITHNLCTLLQELPSPVGSHVTDFTTIVPHPSPTDFFPFFVVEGPPNFNPPDPWKGFVSYRLPVISQGISTPLWAKRFFILPFVPLPRGLVPGLAFCTRCDGDSGAEILSSFGVGEARGLDKRVLFLKTAFPRPLLTATRFVLLQFFFFPSAFGLAVTPALFLSSFSENRLTRVLFHWVG